MIVKDENVPYLQKYSITKVTIILLNSITKWVFIDLPKCKLYSFLSKLTVKNERSNIFAVSNDAQN